MKLNSSFCLRLKLKHMFTCLHPTLNFFQIKTMVCAISLSKVQRAKLIWEGWTLFSFTRCATLQTISLVFSFNLVGISDYSSVLVGTSDCSRIQLGCIYCELWIVIFLCFSLSIFFLRSCRLLFSKMFSSSIAFSFWLWYFVFLPFVFQNPFEFFINILVLQQQFDCRP